MIDLISNKYMNVADTFLLGNYLDILPLVWQLVQLQLLSSLNAHRLYPFFTPSLVLETSPASTAFLTAD